MRIALLFLVSMAIAPAQLIFESTEMTRYLELTSQQTVAVTRLRVANTQFRLEKAERTAVINRELEVELRKSLLDPMAIGLRHVELATIQREIAEADTKLKNDIRALLTEAQKAKLKPLEDAQRLQGLVNQAVCEGFLDPLPTGSLTSGLIATTSGVGSFCLVGVGFRVP
ncbi:MAG: hypothetical protein JST65_09230 [Acidobacteria bacterium]|nr:hypothetical protein [Acidobacteriota bacterium]